MSENFSATRGYGLLENLLSKKRAKKADSFIPESFRQGRILDIGCGTYPYFLLNTPFLKKYGLDKVVEKYQKELFQEKKITFFQHDFEKEARFPFKNEYFDIVTMLAVLEHIDPLKLENIFKEIYRILEFQGMLIITSPSILGNRFLKLMAKFKFVSHEEIKEHKKAYRVKEIFFYLKKAGFSENNLRQGYFELFMNC